MPIRYKNEWGETVNAGSRCRLCYKDSSQWYLYSLDNFAVELSYSLHTKTKDYQHEDIEYDDRQIQTVSCLSCGYSDLAYASPDEELSVRNIDIRRCRGDIILINKAAIDKNHPKHYGEKEDSYLEYNTIDEMTVIAPFEAPIK